MKPDLHNNSISAALPNRTLLLAILVLLSAASCMGKGSIVAPVLMLLLPWAIAFGGLYTVHLVLIFLASNLAFQYIPSNYPPVAGKAAGIALYLYCALLIPPLWRTLDWLRAGKASARGIVVSIGIVAVSALALFVWAHLTHPKPGSPIRMLPAGIPAHFLPVYMIGFALLNSLAEEIIWRGVMLTALEAAFGAGWFALVLQAVQFGTAHYRSGFPNGWTGLLLTALFGLAMGLVRRRTKGLLVPWCIHAGADLAVVWLAMHGGGFHWG